MNGSYKEMCDIIRVESKAAHKDVCFVGVILPSGEMRFRRFLVNDAVIVARNWHAPFTGFGKDRVYLPTCPVAVAYHGVIMVNII